MVAVLSVLAFLLVIAIVLTAPAGVSIDWGLYLIIAFTLLQAIVAIAVLLFDAGVITPPAPQPPRYEQQQYGQYGAPAGSTTDSRQHGGPQQPQQQGLSAASRLSAAVRRVPRRRPVDRRICRRLNRAGPPTPPTGFPAFGQPPQSTAPTTAGTDADAIGDVFHAVGPPTVVV